MRLSCWNGSGNLDKVNLYCLINFQKKPMAAVKANIIVIATPPNPTSTCGCFENKGGGSQQLSENVTVSKKVHVIRRS
jgi:hypothetical protein